MKTYNISLNLPRIYLKHIIISLQTKKYPFMSSASKKRQIITSQNSLPKVLVN